MSDYLKYSLTKVISVWKEVKFVSEGTNVIDEIEVDLSKGQFCRENYLPTKENKMHSLYVNFVQGMHFVGTKLHCVYKLTNR